MTSTIIIQNPKSGSGDHEEAVRKRAKLLGYECVQTAGAGDAVRLAEEAAETGYSTIVAGGGDGTVNEVVRGIDRADALDGVTLGILPLGTGNNFAGNVGISDLDTAFEVLSDGDTRRIDLGRANGRLFVNSCIAGLTADSSGETSVEMKSRLGVLAYVKTTLQSISDFESPWIEIDVDGEDPRWKGEALLALVGNGRKFTFGSGSQANMEDGLFDVTVIEDPKDAIVEEILGEDSPHVVRFKAGSLTIENLHRGNLHFSLDGEMVDKHRLTLETDPKQLSVRVGAAYEPSGS